MEEGGNSSPAKPLGGQSGYTSPDVNFSGGSDDQTEVEVVEAYASAQNISINNNDANLNNGGNMKNGKRELISSWWTWLVVAAVLVGVAVGGWYWSERNQEVIVSNSTAGKTGKTILMDYKDSTLTDWVQYTSPGVGQNIKFQYDSGWRFVDQPSEADLTAFFAKTDSINTNQLNYQLRLANQPDLTATVSLALHWVKTPMPTSSESVVDSALSRIVKVGTQDVLVGKGVQIQANGRQLIYHNTAFYVGNISGNLGINVAETSDKVLTSANEANIQASFDKLLGSLSIKE